LVYSIADYGAMIADRGRIDAYARALKQRIQPDAVVIEIGAGAAVTTMIARQLSASKVYAIETDDIIHLGKEVAAANGHADRIYFIQKRSTEVELPEKADVIVADLRGVFPVFRQSLIS